MPATKIHCDYLEIFGVDWENISDSMSSTLITTISEMELLGIEKDQYGFVSTTKIDTIIGGFFAIQYKAELLFIDDNKHQEQNTIFPFERLFFILFAHSGKLILQNRKFADISLNMNFAKEKILEAITVALKRSRIGYALNLNHPPEKEISPEVFQSEFIESDSVQQIEILAPDPQKIPEGFVYYNPQIDRNAIIRQSHQHDYANFKKVNIEARKIGDLKKTHIAKDLIEAGIPERMKFVSKGKSRTLNRQIPKKVEIYVDIDTDTIDLESLNKIIESLRNDHGLPVDIPVSYPPNSQLPLKYRHDEE